ncbi:PTS-dependent dihydroxyacetone kinase phosphotransferase subunit DhaM [Ornithinibacillus massiliensis]|uniref:phosphoenolpyruvate--glycerone phosphotransferase n=1 Tax=Ornithinibacillus massiliensis TaxID=1944633 RepID=A0ABS5MIR8_9BACI|nr:dihydroxyacetone kinase phosphoryl donor subunit DhaM [Ornithinibacillus massiliensis]MBS3681618.1 PTS-dependent dihydroxyacetone kinase phosphotransferase subunit DhaM [Ornithinibacillus massiliensis]
MSYVGIVLVSHSIKLVEGLRDIIRQVIHEVPVEIAGGTEEGDIGTSVEKVLAAIEKADTGKGVVLFYDLGSAKMNAEVALELAESTVKIVDAPLVEGAYVAAVESNMAKSLEEVYEAVMKEF